METFLIITLVFWAFWALCGFLAYGLTYAFFQNKWPAIAKMTEAEDFKFALVMAITGPVGFIATTICIAFDYTKYRRFYGFQWKRNR